MQIGQIPFCDKRELLVFGYFQIQPAAQNFVSHEFFKKTIGTHPVDDQTNI